MGYTHYFEHTEVPKKVWTKIIVDCAKICTASDIPIKDDRDNTNPKFTPDYIWFNGVGEDSHETFTLRRKGTNRFAFCKTVRKPYDLLVCACLLIYKKHSPYTMVLNSDGFNYDGTINQKWKLAEELVDKIIK